MPTRYQTDPYGRTRQYGPSPGPIPPADLYDVPEEDPSLLQRILDLDLGTPVRNIGKFLGAAAGIPGVELPEEAAGPTSPPSFMQQWGSNIARNLRSTYGAPQPSAPQPQPPKPGLASVIREPTYGPGWQTVPGTQAFSGGTGRWRQEFPLEGATPPSDPAAKAWLDYNKARYGAGYTSERTVGTPEYEAGGAASLRYSNLVDQILRAAEAQGRPELLGQPLQDVFAGWGELGKSEAQILASREARAEKEAQRRENAWLLEQYLGGAGAPPGGGVSEKTLKTGTAVAQARRVQEAAERADRRLDESERRGRMAGPSRSDIITRAQRILLDKGMTVKKTPDGDLAVFQANKPVQGGEKILADALREAERQIRSGAP